MKFLFFNIWWLKITHGTHSVAMTPTDVSKIIFITIITLKLVADTVAMTPMTSQAQAPVDEETCSMGAHGTSQVQSQVNGNQNLMNLNLPSKILRETSLNLVSKILRETI